MSTALVDKTIKTLVEDFSDIKANCKVHDDDFDKALAFGLSIAEGQDKVIAYMQAYKEPDKSEASRKVNRLLRYKYVNEIIGRLTCGNYVFFTDKHVQALNALYDIGMNGHSEKNRVDALTKFIEATKRPDTKVGVTIDLGLGASIVDKLEAQLTLMAKSAKMLSHSGEIIDAEVITSDNR